MPFITSPSILSTKDSLGVVVVPVNRALKFVGASVVESAPGESTITISAGTNTWNESGNTLTGGAPATPNEFFGSLNDYDVIMQRNGSEIARLKGDGFYVTGLVGVGATNIYNLLVDPSAGAGVPAPIGSLGMRDNAGVGETWQKFGAADTDWSLLDSNALDEWLLVGNALTGASPVLPDQEFGSTNDYDVKMIRNNLEVARIATSGFFVTGEVGVGATNILNLLVDPTAGAGVAAPIGSLGLRDNAGVGETWQKFGAADTAWTMIDSTAGDEWLLAGNNLTGAGPTTPNEFFGSNNDYDVVQRRNATEYARFNSTGYYLNILGFRFIFSSNSFAFGTNTGSAITSSGQGSLAAGYTVTTGTITASGNGSFAHGRSDGATAAITASGDGSTATGYANADGNITAASLGNYAGGLSNGTLATGVGGATGSFSHGVVSAGASISTAADGSVIFGKASSGSLSIGSGGAGHVIIGHASGGTLSIAITISGAQAFGVSTSGAITSTADGAMSSGKSTSAGGITASAVAAFARGSTVGATSSILASGIGSVAIGSSTGSAITASGTGSFATGITATTGVITASGSGSFARGRADGSTAALTASGDGASAIGYANTSGTITSSGIASLAGGLSNGTITAIASGAFTHGTTGSGSSMTNASAGSAMFGAVSSASTIAIGTAGNGHFISGYANGGNLSIPTTLNGSQVFGVCTGGTIQATASGAMASGSSGSTSGGITASGGGSFARGLTTGASALMTASGDGSYAIGWANTGGVITSSALGSFAGGRSSGAGGTIISSGNGAMAYGSVDSGGDLLADGAACFAFGQAQGLINAGAGGFGAMAFGVANLSHTILSSSAGSVAMGFAQNSDITASGAGAFAIGYAANNPIVASGDGSHASGYGDLADSITASARGSFAHGTDHAVSGQYAVSFGVGNDNSTFAAMYVGHYATIFAGTTGSIVSTDPAFVVGIGTSAGARTNGFQVDNDGKQTSIGALVEQGIRSVAAADAISARTDHTIICDSTGATGNLTLPAGEKGLTFVFSGSGIGAAVYTLVANGGDTFDANVVTAIAAGVVSRIKYLAGVWYAV